MDCVHKIGDRRAFLVESTHVGHWDYSVPNFCVELCRLSSTERAFLECDEFDPGVARGELITAECVDFGRDDQGNSFRNSLWRLVDE